MTQAPGQWPGQPQPTGQQMYVAPQPYQSAPQPYTPEDPTVRFAPQGGACPGALPYQAAAEQYSQPVGYPQHGYVNAPPPPPRGPECQVCGATPAAKATFAGFTGIIAGGKVSWWRGLYCRTCGLATFRDAMSETLASGWWMFLSSILVPIYVLYNLFGRSRVARLGEPIGRRSQPTVSGPPVFARQKVQIGTSIGILLWVLFWGYQVWTFWA